MMRVWRGGGGEGGGEGLLARASYEGAVGAVAVRIVEECEEIGLFPLPKKAFAFCQFFPIKLKILEYVVFI